MTTRQPEGLEEYTRPTRWDDSTVNGVAEAFVQQAYSDLIEDSYSGS